MGYKAKKQQLVVLLGFDLGRGAVHAGPSLCGPARHNGPRFPDRGNSCPGHALHSRVRAGAVLWKSGIDLGSFLWVRVRHGGIGSAVLGTIANRTSIQHVYRLTAFLPLLGLIAVLLPNLDTRRKASNE